MEAHTKTYLIWLPWGPILALFVSGKDLETGVRGKMIGISMGRRRLSRLNTPLRLMWKGTLGTIIVNILEAGGGGVGPKPDL